MVGNQLFDEVFNLLVVVVKTAAVLGSEYYIFHVFHLCGRTGQTYLLRVGFYVSCAPLVELEFWTVLTSS